MRSKRKESEGAQTTVLPLLTFLGLSFFLCTIQRYIYIVFQIPFNLEKLINWSQVSNKARRTCVVLQEKNFFNKRSCVEKLEFQLSHESCKRFDQGERITGNGNTMNRNWKPKLKMPRLEHGDNLGQNENKGGSVEFII